VLQLNLLGKKRRLSCFHGQYRFALEAKHIVLKVAQSMRSIAGVVACQNQAMALYS
jgi:hypothetical protein